MGQYDRTVKLLMESHPEAMARFVLHQWHKHRGIGSPPPSIASVTLLSEEFPGDDLQGDGVMLVKGHEGPLSLLEIEYQSVLDKTMPLRSLEYFVQAKKKHEKTCGDLPVLGVVIYLFDKEDQHNCPLHWPAPAEQTAMLYHYLIINMRDLPREELLALQEPALWPLALLARGPVDRKLVETMFAELREQKLFRILPLGYTVAGWLLRGEDLLWLQEEFSTMDELVRNNPAIQWMQESARRWAMEDVRQEAEKVRQQVLAEKKETLQFLQAKQKQSDLIALALEKQKQKLQEEDSKLQEKDSKLQEKDSKLQEKDNKLQEKTIKLREKEAVLREMEREIQRQHTQQIREEQKNTRMEQQKALAISQQTVIRLVFERFPSLLPLAKKQVRAMKQLEQYSQLILHLSLARSTEEAQQALLFLVANPEDEEAEGAS